MVWWWSDGDSNDVCMCDGVIEWWSDGVVVYYDGNSNDVCMCDGVMVWWCDGDSNDVYVMV